MSYRRITFIALSNARRELGASLRALVPVLLLGATGLVGACSDQPTAPDTASPTPRVNVSRDEGRLAVPVAVQALLRSEPLRQNVVVSKTISNGGGSIDIPGTDFKIEIPKGAFSAREMTFTLTAYAGNAVAYDFQPHGTVFLKPLMAKQQLSHTSWKDLHLPEGFYQDASAAYFADPSQVNFLTGQATVNEFMSTGLNVRSSEVTWSVPHFSGYIVSWGRQ